MELTPQRSKKITEMYAHRQKGLVVVLEQVDDPHNVNAVLRSCDAVGVGKICFVYPNGKFPRLSESSSASAYKWVEIEKFNSIQECLAKLKSEGFNIYATYLGEEAPSKSLHEFDFTKPSAVILGNEHAGVSKEALSLSDGNIYIPMYGMVQSLNISVANAVILYEACRQRIKNGDYDKSQYTDEEISKKLEFYAWSDIKKRLKK